MLELGAEAGGVVAEDADEPEVAVRAVRGRGAALAAGARGAAAGQAAVGEVGEQAGEALAGAADAGPEGEGETAEIAELGGDQEEERGEDGVQACGEQDRRMGWVRRIIGGESRDVVHDLFYTPIGGWMQGGLDVFPRNPPECEGGRLSRSCAAITAWLAQRRCSPRVGEADADRTKLFGSELKGHQIWGTDPLSRVWPRLEGYCGVVWK